MSLFADGIVRIYFRRQCRRCGRWMYNYAWHHKGGGFIDEESYNYMTCVDRDECSERAVKRRRIEATKDEKYKSEKDMRDAFLVQRELEIREQYEAQATKRDQEYTISRKLGDERCRQTLPDTASIIDHVISALVRWLKREEASSA